MSLVVYEKKASVLDAPENSLIIHACNCVGVWGAGVAKTLRDECPHAYRVYHQHCLKNKQQHVGEKGTSEILGTCLLIPPTEYGMKGQKRMWIGCLFTSVGYGVGPGTRRGGRRRKGRKNGAVGKRFGRDKPDVILESTREALLDLKLQLRAMGIMAGGEDESAKDSVGTTKAKADSHPIACCNGQLTEHSQNRGNGRKREVKEDVDNSVTTKMEGEAAIVNRPTASDLNLQLDQRHLSIIDTNNSGVSPNGDNHIRIFSTEDSDEMAVVENTQDEDDSLDTPGDIWSPKFNSGFFGVPWSKTEKILKDVFEGEDVGGRRWIVATPEDA